jgi:hypothetical protein
MRVSPAAKPLRTTGHQPLRDFLGAHSGISSLKTQRKEVVFVKQSGIAGRLKMAQHRLVELMLSWLTDRPNPLLIGRGRHAA